MNKPQSSQNTQNLFIYFSSVFSVFLPRTFCLLSRRLLGKKGAGSVVAILFLFISGFSFSCSGISSLSNIIERRLDNDLLVLLREDHSLNLVALQLWVKIGSSNENQQNNGISHFIEHMLFKGTAHRKVGQISRQIESKGGNINGATSKDFTNYRILIPAKYVNLALDILTDAAIYSSFEPQEVDRERLVILEEIKRSQDNPSSRLWKLFNQKIYQNSYRRPVLGPAENVESFLHEELISYYEKFYSPNKMVLAITGDLDPEKIFPLIEEKFGDFSRASGGGQEIPHSELPEKSFAVIKEENVQQVYFLLGFLGPDADSQDVYSLDILSFILGEGRSSRLYQELKEKKQLVHSISAHYLTQKFQGPIWISGTCSKENIEKVKKEIETQINRISSALVSKRELKKAIRLLENGYIFDNQTFSSQAQTLGYYAMVNNYTFARDYLDNIRNVSRSQLRDVAKRYFKLHHSVWIVIKPKT